jgi:hypothetical protein
MERRKDPTDYTSRTLAVFKSTGSIGLGLGIAAATTIYFLWPNAPLWAFSLAFGSGFILFLVLLFRLRPKFKCPQCGRELAGPATRGKEGERVRFACTTCQIEWETGLSV